MGASGTKVRRTSLDPAKKHRAIERWRQRDMGVQICAVARHEERADADFDVPEDGHLSWIMTEDFREWPKDPPLSDAGREAAAQLGKELRETVGGLGTRLHVVVCSPYYRCVQTAAHMCQSLGTLTQLLIDHSLGEVYGPEIMGETEPAQAIRPIHEALKYCKHLGVRCHVTPLGLWPPWPEDVEKARRRFIGSFVGYLNRGAKTRRNFVLVTHADAVGAALSVMPSQARKQLITKVNYGGYFLAHRQRPLPKKASNSSLGSLGSQSSLHAAQEPGLQSMTTSLMQMSPLSTDTSPLASSDELGAAIEHLPNPLRHDPTATAKLEGTGQLDALQQEPWQVQTKGVVFRPRHESGHKFGHRVAHSLMRLSPYSRRKIAKVLGELPDVSLSSETTSPTVIGHRISHISKLSGNSSHSSASSISQGTYVFGNVGSSAVSRVESLSSVASSVPDADERSNSGVNSMNSHTLREDRPMGPVELHVPMLEVSLAEGATARDPTLGPPILSPSSSPSVWSGWCAPEVAHQSSNRTWLGQGSSLLPHRRSKRAVSAGSALLSQEAPGSPGSGRGKAQRERPPGGTPTIRWGSTSFRERKPKPALSAGPASIILRHSKNSESSETNKETPPANTPIKKSGKHLTVFADRREDRTSSNGSTTPLGMIFQKRKPGTGSPRPGWAPVLASGVHGKPPREATAQTPPMAPAQQGGRDAAPPKSSSFIGSALFQRRQARLAGMQ